MPSHPEVIVTGALATKVSNVAPYRYAAELISEGTTPIHYVHGGVPNSDGGFDVATPSEQEAQITAIIEQSHAEHIIIISQSMGALAALSCAEKYDFDRVKAVSIAPPLLKPGDVLRSPRIMERSQVIDGQLYLPSYSFALGESGPGPKPDAPLNLAVRPSLYDEIDAATPDYRNRTLQAIRENGLRIVMPTEDWNETALTATQSLPEVTYLTGPHSLITEQPLLGNNVRAIARLATDLFDR